MKKQKFKSNTEGVFYGLPDLTYRQAPGISQSMLKPLAISPAHFNLAMQNPMKPTAALTFGRIGHQLLLTPTAPKFWSVRPEGMDLRSPEGKLWKKANTGKTWVDYDMWCNICGAVDSLKASGSVQQALAGQLEVSLFKNFLPNVGGTKSKSKVLRKGRIDIITSGAALCDFKFVDDAREFAFVNQCYDLKWYLQAAYYLDLYNENFPATPKTNFIFIVVEKEPPYPVAFYDLDTLAITRGRTEYKDLLKLYIDCRKKKEWPIYVNGSSYSDIPKTVGLPKWVNKGQAAKGDFIFA